VWTHTDNVWQPTIRRRDTRTHVLLPRAPAALLPTELCGWTRPAAADAFLLTGAMRSAAALMQGRSGDESGQQHSFSNGGCKQRMAAS
jgi:hypothetical protein